MSVDLDLLTPSPVVFGDGVRIRQAIEAVLLNAVEAVQRTGWIRITTGLDDRPGELLGGAPCGLPDGARVAVITIEDSGPGMDEKTLARLFEPFFTTKFVGRGLGLAAVRGIIKAHHGTIDCESWPGRGTRIIMRFPHHTGAATGAARGAAGAPSNVLVVGADDAARGLAGRVLSRMKLRPLFAPNTAAALSILHEMKDDLRLIIVDLELPGGGAAILLDIAAAMSAPPAALVYTALDPVDAAEISARHAGFIAGIAHKSAGLADFGRGIETALEAGRDRSPGAERPLQALQQA
ncbi:MAG: hybrid sensor histidine kinase/response regulator [Candidatus Schekmanbacteria bacterium]|nr:hybrid sensor histidine kinase/response regulator [Candidatus Schekmanbacteria bacterium]